MSGKWLWTRKMNYWKVWRKKIKKLRSSLSQLLYSLFLLRIPENSLKDVSAPESCVATKHKKKLLLKAIKKLDGNGKYERKIIMWFMILTKRYESNLKATVWHGSEKFISVKIHVLKEASVASSKVTFVDILQNDEKLISSIWSQQVEYYNSVSVSSCTNI